MRRSAQHSRNSSASEDLVTSGVLSTDRILDVLKQTPHPVRMDDLIRYLNVSRREKKRLEALLLQLQEQGKAMRLRGGKWIPAGMASVITGKLSIQRSGAGFVTPDPQQDLRINGDIFIHPAMLGDAWHGDVVEVMLPPTGASRRSRHQEASSGRSPEGRILRVVERGQKTVVVFATKRMTPEGMVCKPADPRLDMVFLTDISGLETPPLPGELLMVQPKEKIDGGVWSALALSSLGQENDASVQERLTKLNHQIPLEFPANVLAGAEDLRRTWEEQGTDRDGLPVLDDLTEAPSAERLPRASTALRQDLRGLPFVTIDGQDARDFDDAIYVRAVSAPQDPVVHELWVAIADVSHFVRPGSPLDREARDRGNSYYFPTSVEPMLPEVLSNGLCSLRPDEDRLVLAARIGIDEQGIPRTSAFFPGLIRSRARLTYDEVHEALPDEDAFVHGHALLQRFPWLRDAALLASRLREQRMARGSLDFNLPEASFEVDPVTQHVVGIHRRERWFSHKLIEEFMLAANEAVARCLTDRGTPFLYRVHPSPDPDKLSSLFRTLMATGLVTNGLRSASQGREAPVKLRTILEQAQGTPREFVVTRLVLRSMMHARYSPEKEEHYGLASPCYCHFTSPIRRYADLVVHRALCASLGSSRAPLLTSNKLLAAADQCNSRERAATEAEREIARRMGCLLLQDRVGEVFSGVIAGLSDFGFFVEFDDMPVEGMVRLETFQNDWFEYDPDRQELSGVSTGRRFRLGQAVKVRLVEVKTRMLEINLEMAESAAPHMPHKGRGLRNRRR